MVVSSLVRRGVELASEHLPKQPSKDHPEIQAPGWLIALLIGTVLAYALIAWSIEYTYGMVIPTLAAVEDSNPDIYVRIETDLDPNKPVDPAESEMAALAPKPVTSALRTTLKHLRARAGRWSRFRGLSMFLVNLMARGFLLQLMPVGMGQFFGQFLSQMAIGVLLANLELAWVHIVISEPSSKRFYQRIPGYKTWLKFAPVVAFQHAVTGAAFYLPLIVTRLFGGLDFITSPGDAPPAKTITFAFGVIAAPSLLAFIAAIPARAVFIRVAASMLPEEDESIVPFDRSFGGKVIPAILGGSGKLSIPDAWKTFDRAARIRFVKAIAKALAIEFAVGFAFALVFIAQILAGGSESIMKTIADKMHGNGV